MHVSWQYVATSSQRPCNGRQRPARAFSNSLSLSVSPSSSFSPPRILHMHGGTQDNVYDQDEASRWEHTSTCPPPPSPQVCRHLSISLSLNAVRLIQDHSHPLYVVQVDACTVCAYMGLSTCPAGHTQVSSSARASALVPRGRLQHCRPHAPHAPHALLHRAHCCTAPRTRTRTRSPNRRTTWPKSRFRLLDCM